MLGTFTVTTNQASVKVRNKSQGGFELYVATAPTSPLVISWTADGIPADLKHAIGVKGATLLLLHVAGDLILGAGIATQSLSVDGLSQSVGTTSSAMYSGYSSRVESLEKQYTMLIKALRGQYKITQFGVV
jgi:hypothetical protein